MPAFAKEILAKLHSVSPFENFPYKEYPHDLQGGGGFPAMEQVFAQIKPRIVVEVGSWKGASATFWAKQMQKHNIDGVVICVDTWLGGIDHITRPRGADWHIKQYYKHGYSTLYYHFLANLMHEGVQDYIVPVPNSSVAGAKWMQFHNLSADLAYIDASHEEDDVYADMTAYWKVLNYGGVMLGDDWTLPWYPVICAVNRFAREKELPLQVASPTWVIQKAVAPEQQLVLNMVTAELNKLKDNLAAAR